MKDLSPMELEISDRNAFHEQNEKNGVDGPKTTSTIEEDGAQPIPYPKRILFIIANEFCERFNYNGMAAILVLFLKYKMNYNENEATVLFHGFSVSTFAMCIFGGIISDVWLGKFKTILYLSIVYAIGCAIVSISSIPNIDLPSESMLLVGLILISLGSGGIKPCVAAFGGDQFKLPEQAAYVDSFFSIYYFVVYFGALLATSVTPILREDVHCFGDNDCFPLAFGVPAVLMLIAIVFFLIGKSSYTCKEISSENILVQTTKCITNAISKKLRANHGNRCENFLDYSIEKYGADLVNDTRALLRIVVLYVPLSVFWTLHDQKGSRWTFQATKMNGDIGFYTIKPDQMQIFNPFLILVFIPFFGTVVYPILSRMGIRRPFQKVVIGLILGSLSFVFAAFVQIKIESSPEKSVSILWLLPQYAAISAGEVMFSITCLAFSYEQAPLTMKSVVLAIWTLTGAFGNLILLFVTKLALFDSRVYEFYFFAGLSLINMMIFAILANNYKNRNCEQKENEETSL